jgi:hypothetical protein
MLVSETSRRKAKKAEEWRVVEKEKGEVYGDFITSDGEPHGKRLW